MALIDFLQKLIRDISDMDQDIERLKQNLDRLYMSRSKRIEFDSKTLLAEAGKITAKKKLYTSPLSHGVPIGTEIHDLWSNGVFVSGKVYVYMDDLSFAERIFCKLDFNENVKDGARQCLAAESREALDCWLLYNEFLAKQWNSRNEPTRIT